jgi:hypothetical protein
MTIARHFSVVLVLLLSAPVEFAQTCTLNTNAADIHLVVNLLRAAWNGAAGDQNRQKELQSVINQTDVILDKKSRLIDACLAFQRSDSDQDWTKVGSKLKSLNSAITALIDDLDDQISSHGADAIGNALQDLRQSLKQKMRDLCGLDSKPITEEQKHSYSNLVDRMKQDKENLAEARGDLRTLTNSLQGG